MSQTARGAAGTPALHSRRERLLERGAASALAPWDSASNSSARRQPSSDASCWEGRQAQAQACSLSNRGGAVDACCPPCRPAPLSTHLAVGLEPAQKRGQLVHGSLLAQCGADCMGGQGEMCGVGMAGRVHLGREKQTPPANMRPTRKHALTTAAGTAALLGRAGASRTLLGSAISRLGSAGRRQAGAPIAGLRGVGRQDALHLAAG